MKMGISPQLKLDTRFRCFVCLEPINLRPMTELPVDVVQAVRDLREGRKPEVCCSCGGGYDFKRRRAAFRRYLQFLAMHLPDEVMCEELEGMA